VVDFLIMDLLVSIVIIVVNMMNILRLHQQQRHQDGEVERLGRREQREVMRMLVTGLLLHTIECVPRWTCWSLVHTGLQVH
jgi:hypothetical protein